MIAVEENGAPNRPIKVPQRCWQEKAGVGEGIIVVGTGVKVCVGIKVGTVVGVADISVGETICVGSS